MTANQAGVREESEGDLKKKKKEKHAPTTVGWVQSINVGQRGGECPGTHYTDFLHLPGFLFCVIDYS